MPRGRGERIACRARLGGQAGCVGSARAWGVMRGAWPGAVVGGGQGMTGAGIHGRQRPASLLAPEGFKGGVGGFHRFEG